MSRIAQTFQSLKKRSRCALVPYITAGDPEPWITVPLMHALVRAGADVLELGVPFSDPMADGPVIQRAAERALKNHVRLVDVLAMVREFRQKDVMTPVVLMGYLNPVEVMGYERFAAEAAGAGVDGVLTVDLPPEEAGVISLALQRHDLDTIFLIAPTSGADRVQRIADAASGFIYYVSLRGVTGASHLDADEVEERLEKIRHRSSLPLGVGFGIGSPEVAAAMARIADAVVVGSAVVRRIEENVKQPDRILSEVPKFIAQLRQAMDAATLGDSEISGGRG